MKSSNKLTSLILAVSIIFGITPKSANCDFAISQIFSRLVGKNSNISAKTCYSLGALASTVAIASNIVQFYNLKNNVTGLKKKLPFYLDNTSNLMLDVIKKNALSLPFIALSLLTSSIPAIPQMILGKKKTKIASKWLSKNVSTPIAKCFGNIFIKTGNYILGDDFEETLSIISTIPQKEDSNFINKTALTGIVSFINLIKPDKINSLVVIITEIEDILQKSSTLDNVINKESEEYKKRNQVCLDLFAKFNSLLGSPITDIPKIRVDEIVLKIKQLEIEESFNSQIKIIKEIKCILIDTKVALKLSSIIDKHANILIDAQKELGLIARDIQIILQSSKDLDKQSEKYSQDYENLENTLIQNYKKFGALLNSPYIRLYSGTKASVDMKLQELDALEKPEDTSSQEQLAEIKAIKLDAQIQVFYELKNILIPAELYPELENQEEELSSFSMKNKLYSLIAANFKLPIEKGKEINSKLINANKEQDYCKKLEIIDQIDEILTKTKRTIDKQELVKNIQSAGTSIGSNVSKFFSIYGASTIWHSSWILWYMLKISKI